MPKDPSMPFYVNDWLSSSAVTCMTLEQQGAYVRLLCYCWASQSASIPADDNVLAKLSGMNEGWFNGGSHLVRKCFEPHPNMTGCLTNQRLFELWKEREEWRRKSAEAGRKSGEARRKSSRDRNNGNANQPSHLVRTKHEPNTNSSSSSSSSSEVSLSPSDSLDSLILKEKERLLKADLIPPRFSRDSTIQKIAEWNHFFHSTQAKKFDDLQLRESLMQCSRRDWGADDLEKSISFSISKGAKNWLDPANDFDRRKAPTKAEGRGVAARSLVMSGDELEKRLAARKAEAKSA